MVKQVFWITPRIAQGPFATEARGRYLRTRGVTHILNVGESPNLLAAADGGFREVAWHPIEDLMRIPDALALACLDAMQRMLAEPGSRVFLHCVAGRNRSPTVLWLYLIARGVDPLAARRLIESRTLDGVAGHPLLYDQDLLQLVRTHGAVHFPPMNRADFFESTPVWRVLK